MSSGARIVGLILAGGLARRMDGRDKAMLEIGGQTLLSRAIARLQPQVASIALNANGNATRFGALDIPVVPDLDDSFAGPLAGVLAGLRWAEGEGASHLVSVAVDTPFFPPDLAVRLREAAEERGVPLACAKTGERTHPVFGYWPVDLADDLSAALGDGLRKVDRWTSKHGCSEAVFEADPFDPFFNVNTPEDLIAAEALM